MEAPPKVGWQLKNPYILYWQPRGRYGGFICALEGPDMGLAAPHCHPAPPEAQGNSWGCLGPAVAMLVAIQRPKRAKSVPRQKGPKPCKSTLGGSRGMKPPQPMAQITQRGPWGVCELHRTTRGTSNKPTTLLSDCGRANHPGSPSFLSLGSPSSAPPRGRPHSSAARRGMSALRQRVNFNNLMTPSRTRRSSRSSLAIACSPA